MADVRTVAYAIPTWNRRETVLGAVEATLAPPADVAPVDVLVHDDGSTDGTLEALRDIAERPSAATAVRLHLSSAPQNAGYGASLLVLLRASMSVADVVILCADDDVPLPAGVPAAVDALHRLGADMLSTPVPRTGRPGLDRRPPRVRRATAPELRAVAAHAPGIVLRTAALTGPLELLEQRLELDCAFAQAYPQAVVALHLLVHGRVRWWGIPVVATGFDLPTGIRAEGGETYGAPVERWRQWNALQELLDDEIARATGAARARLRAVRSAEDVQLLPHLKAGLTRTSGEERRFDRAARRTYADGALRRPARWLGSLLRTPERRYLIARAGDLLRPFRAR